MNTVKEVNKMEKFIDVKNFNNVVYLKEYDISLIKIKNKYIQIPNRIRLKENIDINSIQKLIVTPYIMSFVIKENIKNKEFYNVIIAETYSKKVNININLVSGLYKTVFIEFNNEYYAVYIVRKNETLDTELIKEILNKFESLEDNDLRKILLNRLSKVANDPVKIKQILNKEIKKKEQKVVINNTNNNIATIEENTEEIENELLDLETVDL